MSCPWPKCPFGSECVHAEKRWTRTNKADLARQIAELVLRGLRDAEISRRIGKSRARVCQIVKLFSLRDRTFVR
jgi:hypothetical protein